MKVRFKYQLIVTIFCTAFVILISSITIARSSFSATLLESTKSLLRGEASYIEQVILASADPTDNLISYAKAEDIRITLIDQKGNPTFDSMVDYTTMENHFYRPEIKSAREGLPSDAIRKSITTGHNTLYSATYFPSIHGYVRTAKSIEELNVWDAQFATTLIPYVIIITSLILLVSLILITLFHRPLKELEEAAREYQHGNFKKKTAIEKPLEFERLSSAMNAMATDIETQIEKLTSDRNTYSSILSSMNEGVLLIDTNKRITLCNRSAIHYFGIEVTKPLTILAFFRDIDFDTAVSTTLKNNTTSRYILSRFENISGESALLMGEGKELTYQVIIAPIDQEGEVSGAVITFSDITELKHLEEVRKDFVANVSHELKTPLTSIAGFSNLLVKGAEDAKTSLKFARIIEKNAQQMKGIIEDLLTLATLEKENSHISMHEESLSSIIEESLASVAYKKVAKNMIINFENEADVTLFCSASLMREALVNILSNAIAYSDTDKTITIHTYIQPTNYVIDIIDQGFGIPVIDQGRIFERFYRVDKARSKSSGGTGLGLSIVKHIISLHGGTVSLTSEVGKGSCFTLTIPKERPELTYIKEKSKDLYPHFETN